MTALQLLNELKSNPDAILWLNKERNCAALHNGEIAVPVLYSEAKMARTDPSIRIIDNTDGETLSA